MHGRAGWMSRYPTRMTTDERVVRATLLGTGTSTGVPVIGCTCRVCTSPDPRDRRLRCSCILRAGGVSVLVDAGPDFRYQAMRAGIRKIDAVFVTHSHFDHVAGLDDLRPFLFSNRSPIPVYALPGTAAALRRTHEYIFEQRSYPGVPHLDLREVEGPFWIASRDDPAMRIGAEAVPVWHADLRIAALRVGRFGYATDVNRMPADARERLSGLDVLVLDALRREPHPSHLTIDEAVALSAELRARSTVLIHMTHTVLHAEEQSRLPAGVELGYDGLELSARLDP